MYCVTLVLITLYYCSPYLTILHYLHCCLLCYALVCKALNCSLHFILLSSTVHCTKLFCTVMYRVLHCIKLHSLTVLHCIYCFFSFTLVYTVLYFHPLCTALNCTWPRPLSNMKSGSALHSLNQLQWHT